MTPTQRILQQIGRMPGKHREAEYAGSGLCECGADQPCDALRLARQLEEAVKALEILGRAEASPGLSQPEFAREALSRIEQLGQSEEGK